MSAPVTSLDEFIWQLFSDYLSWTFPGSTSPKGHSNTPQMKHVCPVSIKLPNDMLKTRFILKWVTLKAKLRSHHACIFTALLSFTAMQLTLVWTSPSLPKLMTSGSDPYHIAVTRSDADLINVLHPSGSFLSLFLSAALLNVVGRKPLLVATGLLFVLGWVVTALATSVRELFIARLVQGLGSGICRTAAPIYLVEIAKPHERGISFAAILVFMIPGNLVELILGPFISFRSLVGVSLVIPVLYTLLALCLVESPFYFVMKDDFRSAAESLQTLRQTSDILEELHDLQEFLKNTPRLGYWKQSSMIFTDFRHLKTTLIMIVLNVLMANSGALCIITLTQPLLIQSGLDVPTDIWSIVLTLVMTATSPFTLYFTKHMGIKKLLLVSTSGTSLILAALLWYFYEKDTIEITKWIPLSLYILYFIFINLGFDLFPPVLAAEILHPHVKSAGFAISSGFNNIAQILTFHIMSTFSLVSMFFFFTVNTLMFTLFSYFYLPETKDKSLRTVQEEISKKNESNIP